MRFRTVVLATFALSLLVLASALRAAPTQEDVFKSISDNVGEKSSDSGAFLGVMALIAGAAIIVAIVSKRREAAPVVKKPNHQGKLLKEVLRSTPLRPAEARLLKSLSESQSVENPLVMLLCPSALEKALRQRNGKFERKVAIQLAKKAGLLPPRGR